MAYQPGNEPSPVAAGLRGRCPRCGEGHMFDGFLALQKTCEQCALDYDFADSADGPAVFIMFIVGFVVVGLAMWVEFTFMPPIWLHLVMWFSLTIALALALARPLKGVMIALQYHHRAEEGRREK
ncbi:DUF983 domain-containing protein [Saliniramus sp.]|uniref:DUF983 domain-containing protein n=1 Tax=Saliniramus sp. TaxID=2986772 RepID=UPI002CC4A756|nr:DUF983 domain-containing protein [Saliniramus sp.]HMB10075.1 DUF983 domain-containing protein [Saliniramus sp.]